MFKATYYPNGLVIYDKIQKVDKLTISYLLSNFTNGQIISSKEMPPC